ncbi:MAG: M3 family oligoendopeptidase [archaeon]
MGEINVSKTEWDLSPLLSGDDDPSVEERRKRVKVESYRFIDKWKDRKDYLESPEVLKEALDEYEKLGSGIFGEGEEGIGDDEGYYFWLRTQQDQNNPELKAKYNKVQEFSRKIANDMTFFSLNIGKVSEEKQKEFLEYGGLENYRYFLSKLFRNAKHWLSVEEEKIMSLKQATSFDNWVSMVEGFISKEEREVLVEGKMEKKSFEGITGLLSDQEKETRDSAAEAFNDILKKHVGVAEAEINSILADKKVDDELRKMSYSDYGRHLGDDIDKEVVDAMIEAVVEKFSLAKRYYVLKAKLLGQDKLGYHERGVPIGSVEKKYEYEESIDLVYDVFKGIDEEFALILKSFVEEGKVDVFPKVGKCGGAFCVYCLKSHPVYVLLNHNDKLQDVRTIAHEFGHAINNELSRKKQSSIYFGASTATAEVASTFMEDFVFDRLISEADDELKLNLLMEKLNSDISSISRQIACYKFERELHSSFNEKGYLSKEEIGEIFEKNMAAYMGEAVKTKGECENWWVYWSHIRRFFYVYSYASGLLISKALQRKVRADGSFIEKVKEFLAAGTSASPREIFEGMRIDITRKEFWEEGLGEVEGLLGKAEGLAKRLGKI